jgi:hypothetical protein
LGGGGGGGAESGSNAVDLAACGKGGTGVRFFDTHYAGGGAGSGVQFATVTVYGGVGGGANAPTANDVVGNNGTVNTGGGGSGARASGYNVLSPVNAIRAGGSGGSGIVVLAYPGATKATGGTITSSNGYTIHKFTGNGTFTYTG